MKKLRNGLLWGFGLCMGFKLASAISVSICFDANKFFGKENHLC